MVAVADEFLVLIAWAVGFFLYALLLSKFFGIPWYRIIYPQALQNLFQGTGEAAIAVIHNFAGGLTLPGAIEKQMSLHLAETPKNMLANMEALQVRAFRELYPWTRSRAEAAAIHASPYAEDRLRPVRIIETSSDPQLQCKACSGKGLFEGWTFPECLKCKGSGVLPKTQMALNMSDADFEALTARLRADRL